MGSSSLSALRPGRVTWRSIGASWPFGVGASGATGGGPDPRDPTWNVRGRTLSYPDFKDGPIPEDLIPIVSHDFH